MSFSQLRAVSPAWRRSLKVLAGEDTEIEWFSGFVLFFHKNTLVLVINFVFYSKRKNTVLSKARRLTIQVGSQAPTLRESLQAALPLGVRGPWDWAPPQCVYLRVYKMAYLRKAWVSVRGASVRLRRRWEPAG